MTDHPRDTVYLLIEAEILRRETDAYDEALVPELVRKAADIVQELTDGA
jgi:hypothetical protein